MLTLALHFPAGRYHANPWGRHVNEAAVAWPPEPWRLARALLATWHRKLGAEAYDPDALHRLLSALASETPVYQLPEGIHAHTRHYMPARSGRTDKNTLIFDAFLRLGPEARLVMAWPSVRLDEDTGALLDVLLDRLGYLGRAESWVEARRMEGWEGEPNCMPGEEAVDQETGEIVGEVVALEVPRTPEDYAAVRGRHLEDLETRQVGRRERTRIEASLPEDWLEALSVDTAALQAAGWSAPPAARRVHYVRPHEAVRAQARPRVRAHPPGTAPTTARFALYGRPLPRVEDALRMGEHLRVALMGCARHLLGEEHLPEAFAGHNGQRPAEGHRHAFHLFEDGDGDGRIDHLLLHVPAGLSPDACRVVAALRQMRTHEGSVWQVILESLGPSDVVSAASTLLASSSTWLSASPYLHPWHRKSNLGISDQIRRECRQRGLPEPEAVERVRSVRIAGRDRRPVHFHRFRSKRGLPQPDTQGSFWHLRFPEPIVGPLALGFGCHFGLGLFRPATA